MVSWSISGMLSYMPRAMEEKEGLHKPSSSPPPPPPMGEVEEGSVFMSSGDHGTLIMVPWVWRRSRSRSPKAYGPNWEELNSRKSVRWSAVPDFFSIVYVGMRW